MDPVDLPILEKRLKRAYDRVNVLEGNGIDMGKVRSLIANIEKEAPSQKKENILVALTKLESYLDRVEQLARKKESQGTTKPAEERSEKGMDQVPSPESQPEPSKTSEVSDAAPSEVQAVKVHPVFDKEKVQSERDMVSSLCKEVRSCGGDTSPIEPHLNAMEEAASSSDGILFDQYRSIVLEWLTAYLGNIHRASISSSMSDIQALGADFSSIGRDQDIKEQMENASSRSSITGESALDDLRSRSDELKLIKSSLEEKRTNMVKEISEGLRDTVKFIRKMISDLPEDGPSTGFKQDLSRLDSLVQGGEVMKGFNEGKDLMERVKKELRVRNRSRLEKMLVSVEPLLERISQSRGSTSELYTSLSKEKEVMLELSAKDLDKALKRTEALLDKISLAIADIDEGSVNNLEDKIKEARVKAEDLKDVLDVTPIVSILQRADDLAMEGDVDTATKMVERALSAFDKLKEKKLLDQAALSLSEIQTKMADLSDKAMDITPLQSPVERAKEALERKDLKAFEEALIIVNEKLELLRGEELRVEYHGRLMGLVNELNYLKKEGFDVTSLEKRLDEARAHFHDRKLKDAVEMEKGIREEIGRIRLRGTLDRRLLSVEGTIKEAEGLLLDMEDVTELLNKAREHLANEELKEALDDASAAQALSEDLLMHRTYSMMEKEARQMADELTSFSLDPGNVDLRIKQAYSLADDEKFKEAMESFLQLKDELSRKLIDKKAEWTVKELGNKIKEARAAGMNISPFKASLTKAKVLLDAKDLESAVKVATEQINIIDSKLNDRKDLQSRLDEQRGKLIGLEVKIGQMVKAGAQVDDLKERVNSVRELIDTGEMEGAESELSRLDMDLNALLTPNIREKMASTARPASQGVVAVYDQEKRPMKGEEVDPEEAYEELKIVIKRIQEEMKLLPQKGPRIDDIKKEIVKVQQMVIQKRYVDAYRMASKCYSNIKDIRS
ncbi:MAG: hypothetical protein MUC62_06575 [Candidatus Thermoplasmatota archaeon]|nr:hypothetical protein [Candidatus Thermoplasmatota archaeon]